VRRQRRLADPLFDVSLFRNDAFRASLLTYLLAVFVIGGYFPALAFVVGSQIGPRVLNRYRPAVVMSGGLAVAAAALSALLFVGGSADLILIAVASVIISLGLSPVITMATELIVSSAPQEKAGAASGISETSGELGGALGIALLGSLGTAIYRGVLSGRLAPSDPGRDEALDTLGGAIDVASGLPGEAQAELLASARDAFTQSMRVTAAVSALLAVAIAFLARRMLQPVPPLAEQQATPI
jgi:DHA2 family multidrug resistance protein-like MFS transporter